MPLRHRPPFSPAALAALVAAGLAHAPAALAQDASPVPAAVPDTGGPAAAPAPRLRDVVISASRTEQERFDAPAAIDAVRIDPFTTARPLTQLSELLDTVPGIRVRDRQNYSQDLQLSVRGFGTRSTFGIRGVRILIDGIPATMPDGQGQVSNASLASAERVEVLRGPAALQYGNAAGGVVQIFTREPPVGGPTGTVSVGAGSFGMRQLGASLGGGTRELSGLIDLSGFETDGWRDNGAARRTVLNAKVVARPTGQTRITGVLNLFDQPWTGDPLGLTAAQAAANPRQAIDAARQFGTRKKVSQQQAGVVVEHRLNDEDTLGARLYAGQRDLTQYLAFSGAALNSSGGVVDLDRSYGGAGVSWTRATRANGLPLRWTVGASADRQQETRTGFVNDNGTSGALRRNEDDRARSSDLYAHADWMFAPQWRLLAGVRSSRVRLSIDDRHLIDGNDGTGSVRYSNTSPMAGLVWHLTDALNLYANAGGGFETPTLAEAAYARTGAGPNLGLGAARSRQAEVGAKLRAGAHAVEAAVFDTRTRGEIVPVANVAGRAVFQNVDGVRRRGAEMSWKAGWQPVSTQVAYTLTRATFGEAFSNAGTTVAAGNRLPGVPLHTLYAEAAYQPGTPWSVALEARVESRTYANDLNTAAASGHAVLNLRTGYGFNWQGHKMFLFGRIDNIADRRYIGSLIVNDSNGRFYEPAAGRQVFVGLRAAL
jgi:iron complex outermembrane receptor protein